MNRYEEIKRASYDLLFEKDNRKIIEKLFQFPDFIVQDLHTTDKKHSLTLANIFFNHISEGRGISSPMKIIIKKINTKKELSNEEKNAWEEYVRNAYDNRLKSSLSYIRDWIKGRHERPNPDEDVKIDLKSLDISDATKLSREWHDFLAKTSGDSVFTGTKIISYKDNYYWVDLEKGDCRIEAKFAGHCGKSEFGGKGNLYSLRTADHVIALTADVNKDTKDVRQIRAQGNKKPEKKLHKYIVDFLTNKAVGIKTQTLGKAWNAPTNFMLRDLSESDMNKILKVHPTWVQASYKGLEGLFVEMFGEEQGIELYDEWGIYVQEYLSNTNNPVEAINNIDTGGHFNAYSDITVYISRIQLYFTKDYAKVCSEITEYFVDNEYDYIVRDNADLSADDFIHFSDTHEFQSYLIHLLETKFESLNLTKLCPYCKGKGTDPSGQKDIFTKKYADCPVCEGRKYIPYTEQQIEELRRDIESTFSDQELYDIYIQDFGLTLKSLQDDLYSFGLIDKQSMYDYYYDLIVESPENYADDAYIFLSDDVVVVEVY